jgi:hypothetical protein
VFHVDGARRLGALHLEVAAQPESRGARRAWGACTRSRLLLIPCGVAFHGGGMGAPVERVPAA